MSPAEELTFRHPLDMPGEAFLMVGLIAVVAVCILDRYGMIAQLVGWIRRR